MTGPEDQLQSSDPAAHLAGISPERLFEEVTKLKANILQPYTDEIVQLKAHVSQAEALMCRLRQELQTAHTALIIAGKAFVAGNSEEVRRVLCDTNAYYITRNYYLEAQQKIAELEAAAQETCTWTYDESGCWESGCGESWELFTGGPKENNRYCQGCGKLAVIVPLGAPSD